MEEMSIDNESSISDIIMDDYEDEDENIPPKMTPEYPNLTQVSLKKKLRDLLLKNLNL